MKPPFRYVQSFVDKKTSAAFHYFRRPGFPRKRLPGLPGSREFMAAYQDALDQPQTQIGAKRTKAGTVSAAIVGYYDSTMFFGALAPGTQAMRRAILERFRAEHGDRPISTMPPKFIALMLNRMKPFAARNWLKTIRHLMQFCVAQEMIAADPTLGVKLPRAKSDGIYTWTEAEISQFEAHHAPGTKERLAFALLLYTAQRRGDVVRMGRQHVRDGVLQVRQDKTGAVLAIPLHSDLRIILDAMPGEHLTFLTTSFGRPFTAAGFGNWFRDACNAAGLHARCSAHGLRKAACRRLAEAGCSANEIAAISGHVTLREVERYTKAADQERMARNAMARSRENPTRTPSVKFQDV
jgi:integrase